MLWPESFVFHCVSHPAYSASKLSSTMKTNLLLALVLFAASTLHAATVRFSLIGKGGAGLLSANETGTISGTPGSGGLGTTGISFNDVTKVLSIDIAWGTSDGFTDLSGAATAAHIHGPTASSFPTSYNESAGVLMSIDGSPFTFNSSANSGGIIGNSAALNATQEAALLAGKLYINIHTSTNGSGEIRGNLVPVTETNPVSIIVLTNSNSGTGSLRWAIDEAANNPGPDSITFDPHVFTGGANNTIALTSSIIIDSSDPVTVDASANSTGITIDGGLGGFSLFALQGTSNVTLRALTLSNGGGTGVNTGGAMQVGTSSTATFENCTLSGHQVGLAAIGFGGAISNDGTLALTNCTLSGNQSGMTTSGRGGAISNNGTATLTHCTLANNATGFGGGAITNNGTLTLTHCTLSGNTADRGGAVINQGGRTLNMSHTLISGNTASLSTDIHSSSATVNLSNQNFIGAGIGGSSVTVNGPGALTGNALLGPLADNGGRTRTMLLQTGSPCLDPTGGDTTSIFSTDQRGLARVTDGDTVAGAIVDIGAVEAPALDPANSITFTMATRTFNEEAGTVQVSLTRTGAVSSAASVQVTSSTGTATLADYTAVNTTVNFAINETTKTVPVTLIADPAVKESNESFTLTLSSPTGTGTTLGTPSTCTVTIIDAFDITIPTVTLTGPVNNSIVLEANGPNVNVTGSAADNQGLTAVEVSIDGAAFAPATLALATSGKTGTFTASVNLGSGGPHTIAVRSVDTRGNRSAVTTRTVIHRLVRPLTVSLLDSTRGTVTTGFVPSSNRNVGERYTITATAKPGFVFSGWTANSFSGTGVTAAASELPTLSFLMQPGLSLTANFIANPFTPVVIGTFNGLVTPQSGTAARVDTVGLFQNVRVTSTGTFTSTLKIDGASLPVNGIFHPTSGDTRFGTTRSPELVIVRAGKPSLVIELRLGFGSGNTITGTVKQRFRGVNVAVSDVEALRAAYSATVKVSNALAGTLTKPYTLLFPAKAQTPSLGAQFYPQSPGYATMTVNVNGTVTYVGKLADHSVLSSSGALVTGDQFPIFSALYVGKGVIAGYAGITDANTSTYDVTATDLLWVRPVIATSQWYPDGWPDGITVDAVGARYDLPPALPAKSVFPDLQALNPNTTLTFTDGLLSGPQTFDQTISTSNIVTNVPVAISPTMVITKATGFITGNFPHTDLTKPVYQGVIMQKGALKGASGYFMSRATPLDYLGESGTMRAVAK